MVAASIPTIARVVATATPAVFAGFEKLCDALETAAGMEAAEFASERNERARGAIVAFRAACETRKAFRRKRRK